MAETARTGMGPDSRIFVAGHRGMAGSAISRALKAAGHTNLVERTHAELDLTRQAEVERFFADARPEFVFLAAGKVGGIMANNTLRADFIYRNLMIAANVIDAAWRNGAARLLYLGSSCIYPRLAEQPIREEALLTGPLEPTNEPYAVAKIAGIKLCESYRRQHGFDAIALMPTNLYGPGDNFDPETSHVVPALLRRAHEAKLANASELTVWGTGSPRREFLHVDDLADAAVFLMNRYDGEETVNVGVGEDVTIRELVTLVCEVVGYDGKLVFDSGRPDGTPRKMLDVGRLRDLGWRARIPLRDGLAETYRWFVENRDTARAAE